MKEFNVIEVVVPESIRERAVFEKQLNKIKTGFTKAQDLFEIWIEGGVLPDDYYQMYELGSIVFKAFVIKSVTHKTPFYADSVRIEFL